MRAAIYARVSSPRQGQEQTIESQLDTLKSWANENGYELDSEDVYTDEGYPAPDSTALAWTLCATASRTGPSRWSGS